MDDARLTIENIFTQLQRGVSALVEENLRLARELEAPADADPAILDTRDTDATNAFVENFVRRHYRDEDLAYLMDDPDSYIRQCIADSDADTLVEEFGDDETLVETLRRRGAISEDDEMRDAISEVHNILSHIGTCDLEDVLDRLSEAADKLYQWA